MSRLTKLEMENTKRIRALKLKPKPGVNVIRGANGSGKSSAIDSVEYLFGGARTHPPRVIRAGEQQARVLGETDDGLVATRRWWLENDAERTELEVRAKDGSPVKSPQALLDRLYSASAFDPGAFVRLKPAERLELVKKVVGVDTSELERQREKLYEARTLVNRDLAAAEARFRAMPSEKPTPAVDTNVLLEEQAEAQALQQACATAVSERAASLRRMDDAKEAVKVSEMALQRARNCLDVATKHAAEADNAAEAAEEKVEGTAVTLQRVRTALSEAQTNAAANARWAERERLEVDIARLTDDTKGKTLAIAKLDSEKATLVAAAKFPVPGLGFGSGDVTLDGLPLEQASGAQKLRVGVALAVAANPKLRVALIREGSFLDDDSMALLEQLCEEHDLQAFVEVVGESGPATVVIRDGEVRP
jgi:hypothetical protein